MEHKNIQIALEQIKRVHDTMDECANKFLLWDGICQINYELNLKPKLTKYIYIVKYLTTQDELDESVIKINGRVSLDYRLKICNGFNDNIYNKISITSVEALYSTIRYLSNGYHIEVVFLDDFEENVKQHILDRMNIK